MCNAVFTPSAGTPVSVAYHVVGLGFSSLLVFLVENLNVYGGPRYT